MSDRQENARINIGTGDQKFTVGTFDNNLLTFENTVNVKTLRRCFNERIDREMISIVNIGQRQNPKRNLDRYW